MLTGPIMKRFFAESLRLSDGEVLCMRLASLGMTSEEISRHSDYAVDTVNTYMKTAIRKLGASNRLHAVAEALRRGLIE
jgi:LuxR family transcriptional regulator